MRMSSVHGSRLGVNSVVLSSFIPIGNKGRTGSRLLGFPVTIPARRSVVVSVDFEDVSPIR